MKHIDYENFETIVTVATNRANLERGYRQKIKTRHAEIIEMCRHFGREVKTLPKNYTIVYTKKVNLGTKQWSDVYDAVELTPIKTNEISIRETEKSFIVETKAYREIIPKNKILTFLY